MINMMIIMMMVVMILIMIMLMVVVLIIAIINDDVKRYVLTMCHQLYLIPPSCMGRILGPSLIGSQANIWTLVASVPWGQGCG